MTGQGRLDTGTTNTKETGNMSDEPFMTVTLTVAEHAALVGAIGTAKVAMEQTMDAGVGRPEHWQAEVRLLSVVAGKLSDRRALVVDGGAL